MAPKTFGVDSLACVMMLICIADQPGFADTDRSMVRDILDWVRGGKGSMRINKRAYVGILERAANHPGIPEAARTTAREIAEWIGAREATAKEER